MKVSLIMSEEFGVSANALENAEDAEAMAKEENMGEQEFIALLDFTNRRTESRGDLGPAFEALYRLIEVNHYYEGSLCYAVEEMIEEAFNAGRQYEQGRHNAPVPTPSFPQATKSVFAEELAKLL